MKSSNPFDKKIELYGNRFTMIPKNDFEDAIALIDLIDNDDAKEAVRAALTASFDGEEKKRFWAMLTVEQQAKLNS